MTFTLRPYQCEAVDAVVSAWKSGTQRPAVVMPTGDGKTVTFGGLLAQECDGRSLILAHREELIDAAARKARALAPHLRVGIVKAERDQTTADIVVGSVQTMASARRLRRLHDVRRVVVDECHHAAAASYMTILSYFGCFDEGGARAVGFTATMMRGDEKALGDVWQDVVYTRTIAQGIAEGTLVRPRGLRVRVPDLNLRGVGRSRGDFKGGELGAALEGSMAPELVAKAYAEHAPGLQGILFAPLVSTAEAYAAALRDVGISALVVSADTPRHERKAHIAAFERGDVQVLCNAMLFTEGTDLPMAQVCVIGRPTLNRGLLIQMVGRVLRPHPGKEYALVLDVSGATERHSLLGAIDLFGEEGVDVPVEGEEVENADDPGLVDLSAEPATELDAALDEGPEWLTGPVETVEVDLFHGSKSLWLRTHGGMWFIPTGPRYLLVQPSPERGLWDVIRMGAAVGSGSSWIFQGAPDLGFAMALAEGDVTRREQMAVMKERRWWNDQKASPKARAQARAMGIALPWGATAGEANAALVVEMASRRIDPYVPEHARRR